MGQRINFEAQLLVPSDRLLGFAWADHHGQLVLPMAMKWISQLRENGLSGSALGFLELQL